MPSEKVATLPLPDFIADYTLRKGSFRAAKSTLRLQHNNDHYLYTSETRPVGLIAMFRSDVISETSVMKIYNNYIRPIEYKYLHKGKEKRNVHLNFDWDQMRVTNTVQGHSWSMDIPEGTLDKFSVRLAAMISMTDGIPALEYKIADGGILKTYTFTNLGNETIETPAGKFEAIKLKRERTKSKRTTYLWLAPSQHYIPVRIEHVESDGGKFNMVLDKVRFNPAKEIPSQ